MCIVFYHHRLHFTQTLGTGMQEQRSLLGEVCTLAPPRGSGTRGQGSASLTQRLPVRLPSRCRRPPLQLPVGGLSRAPPGVSDPRTECSFPGGGDLAPRAGHVPTCPTQFLDSQMQREGEQGRSATASLQDWPQTLAHNHPPPECPSLNPSLT